MHFSNSYTFSEFLRLELISYKYATEMIHQEKRRVIERVHIENFRSDPFEFECYMGLMAERCES